MSGSSNIFIGVSEARRIIATHTPRIGSEKVDGLASVGRVLAEPVVSEGAIPPFDNSAMDGYAVRRADIESIPVTLEVAEEIAAGSWPERPLAEGICARIMTGAPLPEGADAVVPVEWTTPGAGEVVINRAPDIGYAVRRAGEDVGTGETVMSPGTRITPPAVGLLASVGCDSVSVSRRPVCAILTTGSELVSGGDALTKGQIRDSNGPALSAQVGHAGAVVGSRARVGDDRAALEKALHDAHGCDIVILSGGVSVGKYDLVQEVLVSLGVTVKFWKVRQRPGKPLLFGLRDKTLFFGVPGNPVSSYICFDQYVRPAIHAMMGRQDGDRIFVRAMLTEPLPKVAGLTSFARGVHAFDENGQSRVRLTGPQGSGVFTSLVKANCIVHLPEDLDKADAGDMVRVELLDWAPAIS